MIGSFLTRGLVLVFGYAYPAYACFKTVELNKPDIQQLRFWCQYWIIVAAMAVLERIGDVFIFWIPMYSEAKLAFYIYLWFPKTMGTTYVYNSLFRPLVIKHESEIDRNLLELRTAAGDLALAYWRKAFSYSQTRIFEILQYIISQSTLYKPSSPSAQPQDNTSVPQPATKPQNEEQDHETAAPPAPPSSGAPKETPKETDTKTTKAEPKLKQTNSMRSTSPSTKPAGDEPVDAVRDMRARLRKVQSNAGQ